MEHSLFMSSSVALFFMSFSNLVKKTKLKFKEQESTVKNKSMEQEKALLIFAKFIGLKASVEEDYSNSLGGILRSLEHAQIDGMSQVESSLTNEVEVHSINSENLTNCTYNIQSLLLAHRTKALMSSTHLSRQQQDIFNLMRKCEALEKNFKRSKSQYENNQNQLNRRKTIFQKVKFTLQRNSSSSSLSSHIVGESWKERNGIEKICAKYLITLSETYSRMVLLETMDLKRINESINDAFLNIVRTYLQVCVPAKPNDSNKRSQSVNYKRDDENLKIDQPENDILVKLDEIYNYYYTFCLKSQSGELLEQLAAFQNDLSAENMRISDKINSNNTEQLQWRQLEIQVANEVLNIQRKLVTGEISPAEIVGSVQSSTLLTYIGKPVITRQTTATLLSKQNSEVTESLIQSAIKQNVKQNRNSMLQQYYTRPNLSYSTLSTNKNSNEDSKSGGFNSSLKSANSMDSIFTSEAAHAKMRYPFSAKQDDELSLDQDEEVEILETLENGWTIAKSHGKEGLVPTSYLQSVM